MIMAAACIPAQEERKFPRPAQTKSETRVNRDSDGDPVKNALAEDTGTVFIDLNTVLNLNGALKPEYPAEGLHITNAAYAVWAKVIKRELHL
jgi:hypothetical protein